MEQATFTIKNFRVIVIGSGQDLYDSVNTNNQVIHVSNSEGEGFAYFGWNEQVQAMQYDETPEEYLTHIASHVGIDQDLVRGLLQCANDEDEDGLFDYMEKNGGKLAWFDLLERPMDEKMLTTHAGNISVLFSKGEMEAERCSEKGLAINEGLIHFSELAGRFDEEVEVVVVYER
jgi:hypothetical protein